MIADIGEVEVVVAHSERATLRVGDVFLKIDADQARIDVEVAAMAMVLPVILFSAFVQRYLVRGLTFGAVKE